MSFGDDRQNDWSNSPEEGRAQGADGHTGGRQQPDAAFGPQGRGGGRGKDPRRQRPHNGPSAAEVDVEERMGFIRRTYAHLAGAIFALVFLEFALFQTEIPQTVIPLMVGGKYSWLIVLGLFMGAGYIADRWARSPHSQALQYLGLGTYVAIWAIMLMPMVAIAGVTGQAMAIPTAAGLTLLVFGVLTAIVFITKQDFSFLGIAIGIGSLLALGGIVLSIIFGFQLGIWFSVFMVGLASIYILYSTSNILHVYHPSQHVAAALGLFASVALLFWYILTILMGGE
ncbi:MAG: Bax inhibitor-1 family protein [Persicimonas sp.]